MGGSLDYAKEVYAACATIGFDGEEAVRLKAWLDRSQAGDGIDEAELVAAAQAAHLAAANWAGR